MNIEINNESGVEVDEAAIISVAQYSLTELNVDPVAELSIILVDIEAMSSLHEEWMDEPGPTDVLSFPMDELRPGSFRGEEREEEPESILGDIVLCPEFATDQAAKAGHSLDAELALLTVHGVLHLLGYDHAEPDEEKEMFGLQQELLTGWRSG